jgi:hypothetical protein
MTKKKATKGAAAKAVALSPEEFQKLTPEQQLELLNNLQSEKTFIAGQLEHAEKTNAKLKASVKSKDKEVVLPSFEVDEDKKNGIAGGVYGFTCPSFTFGGKVYKAEKVVADAESDSETVALEAQAVLSALVSKKSGIVKLKED